MNETAGIVTKDYESRLIERARSGDREGLRELVVLHEDRLFAFIWRMTRNYHDAEEICQDAFLKAFASLDSFCSEYRFSTWLFTIGYRVCLNRMCRKRLRFPSDVFLIRRSERVTLFGIGGGGSAQRKSLVGRGPTQHAPAGHDPAVLPARAGVPGDCPDSGAADCYGQKPPASGP